MALSIREKAEYFSTELNIIRKDNIRDFVEACLAETPDYIFLDCPSASSGKHHPIDELGADGLVLHTKKVFLMANDMVRALDCEHSKDYVLAAAIIHDLLKQGKEKTGHTVYEHPHLAADMVEDVQYKTNLLEPFQYVIIRNCVGYHYGPWSSGDWKKPMTDYSPEEMALYLSDYVVSKRFIITDYRSLSKNE